jgi:uncharacterized protein YecT (DUF1311 family)
MQRIVSLCALLAALTFGTGAAKADEMDEWCSQAKKASSIFICSDLELRLEAVARGKLFESAKATLSPAQYKVLMEEQAAWVREYTAFCGVALDGLPPPLPIPPTIINCYRRESRDRTTKLAARLPRPQETPISPQPTPSFSPTTVAPAPAPTSVPRLKDTGYDMYLSCQSEQTNSTEYLRCLTFVHGVWDGAMTMQNVSSGRQFCPRTGVQVGQLAMVFVDWARNHPADLGHDAALAVLASFVDAFPCPPPPAADPNAYTPTIKPADILVK